MAIKDAKELRQGKIKIDLTGPEGNVFFLIKAVGTLGRQLGMKDVEAIRKDMMSSDYDHAVQVFDKHFGEYVDLYR